MNCNCGSTKRIKAGRIEAEFTRFRREKLRELSIGDSIPGKARTQETLPSGDPSAQNRGRL